MKCKWVKVEDFNFDKETEFKCYIFWDGKVMEAKYIYKRFSFAHGFCGIGVPSHVMKIDIPKQPKIKL